MTPSDGYTGVTGDLLLLASVVLLAPTWIGGAEFLAAMGLGELPAAVVGGAYAWGRGGLSAAILLRRWRAGSLTLTQSWIAESLESVAARSPMADYPMPTSARLTLSTGAPAAV
ncbi:hypothetical protein [Halolamina sediminis]|uniref:hypothetical protein n=1 Tax=Halolamina sediminis TaxID=1480675 RepID=UPI0006B65A31|nr:hypothetical protein [Halolamina sediminis]